MPDRNYATSHKKCALMKIERNNIITEKGLLEWFLAHAVNIEDLEKQLTKYKSSYMKANPHAD